MSKKGAKLGPNVSSTKVAVSPNKARLYYRTLNWAEMWDTFLYEIKPNGAHKYPTAWSFAASTSKRDFERQVVYQAIGPEPKPSDKKMLNVPWQGDWVERRAKGFWIDPDGSKTKVLREAIETKAENLETLKRLSVIPASFLDLYDNAVRKIVEHFGGQPLLPDLGEQENYHRAKSYLGLIDRCRAGASSAIDDVAKCLGLHPDAPDRWTELAVLSAENGARAALRGQQQGLEQGAGVTAGYVSTLTNMVKMIVDKSASLDLPLPSGEEVVIAKNGTNGANGRNGHK